MIWEATIDNYAYLDSLLILSLVFYAPSNYADSPLIVHVVTNVIYDKDKHLAKNVTNRTSVNNTE